MTDSDDGLSQTLSVQQQSEDDLMADAPGVLRCNHGHTDERPGHTAQLWTNG